jgi:hypothetical protein
LRHIHDILAAYISSNTEEFVNKDEHMLSRIKTLLATRSLSLFDGIILTMAVFGTILLVASIN